MSSRILILGGTTEGRLLASAVGEVSPATTVITSLAGRTSQPLIPYGELRIGGFGGVDGLSAYVREQRIDVLVDATHPFAATMTRHAVAAAERTGVPVLLLRRPGFVAEAGDDWRRVPSLARAAAVLPSLGRRVFLSTGRQGLATFAGVDCWFLCRSVEPPEPPFPAALEVVLDRGPFTIEGELALLREHRIEVVVTKDSGGPAPKLRAARELGIPVVVVDRPVPPEAPVAGTVSEAVRWLAAQGATITK